MQCGTNHRCNAYLCMYEHLLELGSQEVPDCVCGQVMRLMKTDVKSADAAVKHFECESCGREVLLSVWPEDVVSHQVAA